MPWYSLTSAALAQAHGALFQSDGQQDAEVRRQRVQHPMQQGAAWGAMASASGNFGGLG